MPKTGTTSIDKALEKNATIRFAKSKKFGLKHICPSDFQKWQEVLEMQFPGKKFESCCIMREPIDWIRSWYKYRSREAIKNQKTFTGDITFDQYLKSFCEKEVPTKSLLNQQSRYLFPKKKILIDRIFPYEKFNLFLDYLTEKIGQKIEIENKNISPKVEEDKLIIKEDTLKMIKKYISLDQKIYSQIIELGSFDSNNKKHKILFNEILRK